jgi:hypothetical protein
MPSTITSGSFPKCPAWTKDEGTNHHDDDARGSEWREERRDPRQRRQDETRRGREFGDADETNERQRETGNVGQHPEQFGRRRHAFVGRTGARCGTKSRHDRYAVEAPA